MRVFRDSVSIRNAAEAFPALAGPLARLIEELSEFGDYELHELINIVVAEPGDRVAELSAAMNVTLRERRPDSAESHSEAYELTYVLSDDGFGLVLYVPRRADIDPDLLAFCMSQLSEGSS